MIYIGVTCIRHLFSWQSFQRRIHEELGQLEHINKQYRRLAREGRIDSSGELREQVYDVNGRWDALTRYVHAILRRVRYTLKMRECFVKTRENLLLWLIEVGARLDEVDNLPDWKVDDKIDRVRVGGQTSFLDSPLE